MIIPEVLFQHSEELGSETEKRQKNNFFFKVTANNYSDYSSL